MISKITSHLSACHTLIWGSSADVSKPHRSLVEYPRPYQDLGYIRTLSPALSTITLQIDILGSETVGHRSVRIISIADDLDADFNGSGGGYTPNERTAKIEREKDQTLTDRTVVAFVPTVT